MKSPLASVGIAAVLTAGLVLAPGLSVASPALASTTVASASTSPSTSPATSGTITTYGIWFIPCDLGFMKWC